MERGGWRKEERVDNFFTPPTFFRSFSLLLPPPLGTWKEEGLVGWGGGTCRSLRSFLKIILFHVRGFPLPLIEGERAKECIIHWLRMFIINEPEIERIWKRVKGHDDDW